MADVFISYSSKDRARIAPLAENLAAAGYSVWWANEIRGGNDFAQVIEREVKAARVVVVAWTEEAIASQWVRDEASFARNEGKLVPILLGVAEPPMGFRQVQALDFRQWAGDPTAAPFNALLAALGEKVTNVAPTRLRSSPLLRFRSLLVRRRLPLALTAAALSGAVAIGVLAFLTKGDAERVVLGEVELRPFAANPPGAERSARAATFVETFRHRFTEVGIKTASAGGPAGDSEFILAGELGRDGARDFFTAHLEDRRTGATLWSMRGEPTEGAAWESNLAAFALSCALKRRDPAKGPDLLSRYLAGCAAYLKQDFRSQLAAATAALELAPEDPAALGFLAIANAAVAYIASSSIPDRDRKLGDARRLAQDALKREPKNYDALIAMGFTHPNPRFAEQERWWRAALEAEPGVGWGAGRYASFLAQMGRTREAMDMEMQAMQFRRTFASVRAANLFLSQGDHRAAGELFDLIRPFDPARVAARELSANIRFGDADAAARMLEERKDAAGDDFDCWSLVVAARRKLAIDSARFAEECSGGFESPSHYALAGDLDGAYREMDAMLPELAGLADLPILFGSDMVAFRADPRFFPLARKMGLVDYWRETDQWPDFCFEPSLGFDCKERAASALAAPP